MSQMKKIILASNNAKKIKEIREILSDFNYEVVPLKEAEIDIDIEENGTTFEENAYIKAKTIYDLTGIPAIADDSGLEVYALNGAPGIYSARFAGEHGNDKKNNEKLLNFLKGVEDDKRGGRFVSAVVLITEKGNTITATGTVEGKIGYEEKGEGGFGYDPLFIIPSLNKTFAELSPEEKNKISHRGNALTELKKKLRETIV